MADYVTIRKDDGSTGEISRALAEDAIQRGTADFTIAEPTKVIIPSIVKKKIAQVVAKDVSNGESVSNSNGSKDTPTAITPLRKPIQKTQIKKK